MRWQAFHSARWAAVLTISGRSLPLASVFSMVSCRCTSPQSVYCISRSETVPAGHYGSALLTRYSSSSFCMVWSSEGST